MNDAPRDNKTFETKVLNLINATRHLGVPQILLLRRLTMADPESLKWATKRQLEVVFSVLLTKAMERLGQAALTDARMRNFDPLLTPDPTALDEDLALLNALTEAMLGPPKKMESELEAMLHRLLTMGPQAAKPPILRQSTALREPPPLFAAQLGPDAERIVPGAESNAAGLDLGDKPFTDFNTLFDDVICAYTRKLLSLLQVPNPTKPGRRPFALAPEFALCYEDVLRRFVLPSVKSSRHIQQMGETYNWAEVGGGKLIDIIQGSEVNNPVLHNWDNRWGSFRAVKGKKPKPEDDPWPLFREDAAKSDYIPPDEDSIRFMQDLLRFETESIGKAWRELDQLYVQEFHPNARQEQAREGAFRDGLMKWVSKLPEGVGDLLAVKSYYLLERIDAAFMRRLLTNFGRTDNDRRRAAPLLFEFVQGLSG